MQSVHTSIRGFARSPWLLTLLVILLAALALRLYALDWDDGADLHPDELFVAKIVLIDRIRFDWPPRWETLFDPARSGLNPRSADPATGVFREFAYGSLPLWVTDFVAWIASVATGIDWNGPERAYLVGRTLSALLSALTVLPVAYLGKMVAGWRAGLAAAVFAALAPMSIQLAHFFTTDSWLTFFVALCLLASAHAATSGRLRDFLVAGGLFGAAMATKGSVFTLAVPIVVAVTIGAQRQLREDRQRDAWRAAAARVAGSALAAMAVFFAFEPFALLRPDVYLKSLTTQADIVSGAFDVPFTRVYAGTAPVLYQIEQFVRWGFGPAAGLLALAGLIPLAIAAVRGRSAAGLILLSWFIAYGTVIAVAQVKFLRYLEPLSPVFAVAAGIALARLGDWIPSHRFRLAARPVTAFPVVAAALWTAAFLAVYAGEHPRVAASQWLYANAAPGSTLTAEYWDDGLPRSFNQALLPASFGFGTAMLDLYRDWPPTEASDVIYEGMAEADYIVQSSRRVESAVAAAPWRYPVQGRFFDQLGRGTLGFDLAAEFVSPPTIAGITIDDRAADESFLNYDHPTVSIYASSAPPDRATYDAAMAWALQRPWFPTRAPPVQTLLLDTPVGENPSVNDARWSAAWTTSTGAAAVVWVLLLCVLLGVGWPIASAICRNFPDQGWGMARVLALIVAAYPVWLGASLELIRFRAVWVVLALSMVGIAGWKARGRGKQRQPSIGAPQRRARYHAEALFWIVFALFLALRLIVPDGWHPIWGGEKAMEFAQINAIGRSAYFPPYDPWFADGYVNYYYYGFFLVSFLLKATGIPAEIGFNLALPAMMAMLAAAGFSVGAALAHGITRSPRLAILGGWGAGIALSVLGNLSALRGLIAGRPEGADPFIFWTWNGSRAIDNAITEFPYFTGLYADLHAHVVALPITVVVIGLSLALVQNAARARTVRSFASPRVISNFASIALAIGTLSATNAWDVPVYALLAIGAIFMAVAGVSSWSRRIALFVAGSLATLVAGYALFLPFHRHFVALFSQVALVQDPTDLLQFLGHLGALVMIAAFGLTVLLSLQRSSPVRNVMPWVSIAIVLIGISLLTMSLPGRLPFLASAAIYAGIAGPPVLAAWRMCNAERWPSLTRFIGLAAMAAFLAVSLGAIGSGRAVFALCLTLGGTAAVGWFLVRHVLERFACLLLAAGFLTAAGVEILVVADDLLETPAYRMNTVFKFYNQIWVLLGIAGAALVALMVRESLRGSRNRSARDSPPVAVAWARAGLAVTVVLVAASSAYPLLATGPRLEQRFVPGTASGTLDALNWMRAGEVLSIGDTETVPLSFAGDLEAIRWFNSQVAGSPVIAEASIGPYRCNGSRISAATGLPTIIGWERHQQQQRYLDGLAARVEDVRRLYTSPDPATKTEILRRYNVEYVVVGDLERRYPLNTNECTPTGSPEGIAAFAVMVGSTLEIAFAADGTTVYRVLPPTAGS